MEKLKVTTCKNIEEFGKLLGLNTNEWKMKKSIFRKIRTHCQENNIDEKSLRKISKIKKAQSVAIFDGFTSKLTFSECIKVLNALGYNANIRYSQILEYHWRKPFNMLAINGDLENWRAQAASYRTFWIENPAINVNAFEVLRAA